MKNSLLGKVEHFRDVFEVSGTALNTGLNLLIVIHDGHDCVHGGVVHLVHLVSNQDHWLCVLLPQGHSVQDGAINHLKTIRGQPQKWQPVLSDRIKGVLIIHGIYHTNHISLQSANPLKIEIL